MRVLHICLSCFYIDDFSYQENMLPLMHKQMGHEVQILASTESFRSDGNRGYTESGTYSNCDGISVTRLPYKIWFPREIMRKIRIYQGTYEFIQQYSPELIFFHGLCAGDIITVSRYVKYHPKTILVADSHADQYNSAQNFISKNVLHKFYYRHCVHKALPQIKKIYGVSPEAVSFVNKMYKVPNDQIECLPLGGRVLPEKEYQNARKQKRRELNIPADGILFVHSGKLMPEKKTRELINAFKQSQSKNAYLAIIGVADDSVQMAINEATRTDKRITFLGWKSGKELQHYLCAADVYAQPGTQSATLQNAICARCAIMIYLYPSHKILMKNNGYYVSNEQEMLTAISDLCKFPEKLREMQRASEELANNLLDYQKQAQKVIDLVETAGISNA